MAQNTDQADLFGGIALGVAALAALLIANSPLGPQYSALIQTTAEIRIGSIGLSKSLEHWINDGLMAIFFLLVGLEIKREVIEGSLAGVQKAALPVIAAIGGFVLPTMFYATLNWGDAQALRGWAVPAATDIAFAIGICALLGRAVPTSLRMFLLALAEIEARANRYVAADVVIADCVFLGEVVPTGTPSMWRRDLRTPRLGVRPF